MPIIDIFIYYLFLPVSSFEKGAAAGAVCSPSFNSFQFIFGNAIEPHEGF